MVYLSLVWNGHRWNDSSVFIPHEKCFTAFLFIFLLPLYYCTQSCSRRRHTHLRALSSWAPPSLFQRLSFGKSNTQTVPKRAQKFRESIWLWPFDAIQKQSTHHPHMTWALENILRPEIRSVPNENKKSTKGEGDLPDNYRRACVTQFHRSIGHAVPRLRRFEFNEREWYDIIVWCVQTSFVGVSGQSPADARGNLYPRGKLQEILDAPSDNNKEEA